MLVIGGYLLFCFFCKVLPIVDKSNLEDVSNLLFLNTETLTNYGLTDPSFSSIIIFCLFFYLLFYLLFNSVNEYTSFGQMKMYRSTKKDIFIDCFLRDIKNCTVICILTFMIIVTFTLLLFRLEISLLSVLTLSLYLLKFFSYFYLATIIYDIGSFIGLHTQASLFGIIITMALLLLDVTLKVHMITYSGSLKTEISASLIMMVLNIMGTFFCWKLFKKRGDVL